MSQNLCTGFLSEEDVAPDHKTVKEIMRIDEETPPHYPMKLSWKNIFLLSVMHGCLIYSWYYIYEGKARMRDIFILFVYSVTINMGITAGAHRLWTHRSYKAKLPLKIILVIFNTLSIQTSIYEWVRDHRSHHKFTETNADPHNIKRGFFFAHMGWLLCSKHPEVKKKGKLLDMSDIENDPLLMWQHRNYPLLVVLCTFVITPVFLRSLFNPEAPWYMAIVGASIARHMIVLHITWLVNSYAHVWGTKPYDKYSNAYDTKFVALAAMGEGWHNYHHVFPWDYKTSELGFYRFNITTAFIDFFAWIGWAYDLKTVPKEVVMNRILKTGDGSHPVWGWGDKNIHKEFLDVTVRINKKK